MSALALPALFFLQSLLGFICFPLGMVYADQPRTLDQVIAHIQKDHYLPSPQILFLGDPEYASPMASALYIQSPDFFSQMLDEQKRREDFYGLVIIQAGGDYPTRLSQLMQWGNNLLKRGGWLVIYNFKSDSYEMAFKKE